MSSKVKIILPVSLATLIFLYICDIQFHSQRETQNPAQIISPVEIMQSLEQQIQHTQPGSEERRKLVHLLHKVRSKADRNYKKTDNPEAFGNALAELKTGPGGKRYPKNYLARELNKALKARTDRFKGLGSQVASAGLLPWQERGPGNVSGRAQAVVIDQSDPTGNTWFAATIGGGVWKTTDAGATWEHKTPELTIYATGAIVQAPSNPDVFYVGTGMGYGRVVDLLGNGIWKSFGTRAASGVYLYRLEANTSGSGGFVESKKMTLLK